MAMPGAALKDGFLRTMPSPMRFALRCAARPDEGWKWLRFLAASQTGESLSERWSLMNRFYEISHHVPCGHTQYEMISVAEGIFSVPASTPGCIVEAGCFKGGSAAKFSLVAKWVDRKVVLFDSFEGMPGNTEAHGNNIFGEDASDAFPEGSYRGGLEEVKATLRKFGELDRCEFQKGWFENTMVDFKAPIAAAYIDVDLASSTRTCLKYLYPLMVPGGVLYSQDGHLPLVIEVLRDERFWQEEVGCSRPDIEGLGTRKLVKIVKR